MSDRVLIIGIDPSTTVVGWCAWSSSLGIKSGQINLRKKGWDAWDRLGVFYTRLDELIELLSEWLVPGHRVVMACEETMGSHANPDTDRKMGASMGIVRAVAARYGLEFLTVHPKKVKATGFCKDSVISLASAAAFAGKDKVGPDEADAIGVTQAALVILRERGLRA